MDIFDKEKTVISCFDLTGNMVRPWAEAGYLCYCVDIQHPQGEKRQGNIIRVGADMRDWLPPFRPITFAAFFPPCTDVAVSGARWFRDKGLFALFQSIRLFYSSIRIAEWTRAPYLIENPVSTISTYWRKPDFTFDPCDYAGYPGGENDLYTKKTCLWTGGGFIMPPLDGKTAASDEDFSLYDKIEEPEELSLVFLQGGPFGDAHIAVYTEGALLHMSENGPCCQDWRRLRRYIRAIYRPRNR